MKEVTDSYSCQWPIAIYKDLGGHEHIKRASIELLWSPQFRTRCPLCQDKYDKSKGENMSANLLRHSVMPANLSPRVSELDLIDAVTVYFPPYVQRVILSANVRTIQMALSFLSKLKGMESGHADWRSNQGRRPITNRTKTTTLGAITVVLIVIEGMSITFGTLV
jgi:hypothetical protein